MLLQRLRASLGKSPMAIVEEYGVNQSDHAVFRGKAWPWVIASTAIVALVVLLNRLHGLNLITLRESQSGNLFFGVLIANVLPRAIPGLVEMRLSPKGISIRDGLYSRFYAWDDITGNIAVTSKPPLYGVNFLLRNARSITRPFIRINLFDTYGYPPESFADMLNSWRRSSRTYSTS